MPAGIDGNSKGILQQTGQSQAAMKSIAVFGATGRTGRRIVSAALRRGYVVEAHCRKAASLPASDAELSFVAGPLYDTAVLRKKHPCHECGCHCIRSTPPFSRSLLRESNVQYH